MSPGSCFTITYRAVMPYNFYRGVEAIKEGEINPSDENEAVTHFLSEVSFDEVTFIEGNVRHYLKIWDGKGWNKPAWKYVFSNENSSKEHHIGQSFDNWPSGDAISLESGHEIFNDFYNQDKPERDGMRVSDDICLSTENITEYLNISLSNFQEESIEFFPIKLRLPNREPEIEFFVDRDANNFLSYEFHTYVSDDYTLSKNIDVEVDFFEVIDEGEKKLVYQKLLNDGGKPQYFDYQFPSAGIYKLEIKAIDDEGFPNIQEIEVYPGSPFIDLKPSEWYTKSILLLHQNGILKGYEDGTFGVGNPVTRAEFLKIMLLTHDLITTNKIEEEKYKKYEETEFSDVKNDWKLGYIEHAREKGYVAGYPPKDDSDKRLFSPDNTIIRAEAAKIIANVFILDQKDISDEKDTSDKKKIICPQEYSDEKNSNAWYCEFLTALKETNIMTGYEDGSFGAAKEMTRAQAAVVACRAYAYKKDRNINDFCDTRK
ncbi:MAG: S-layer homology domain-containing protein [Pseudomonadota bacterium]|nr:S-layer homology domain-containing protein [Pseudomonadota bacterium]